MANKEAQRLKRERIIEENGIIFLDNVSKSYSTGSPALNGVTLSIGRGEFVFIVGDSGSGKSTLIKLLLRELTSTSGSVYVMGNDLAKLKHRQIPRFRRNLGVVFQDFRLLKDKTVYENAGIGSSIGNIYDLVRENKWTMDKFVEMIKAAAQETSGNSEYHYSEGDILGWVRTGHATHGMHVASAMPIIANNNGVLSLEMVNNAGAWNDVIDQAISVWSLEQTETLGYSDVRTALQSGNTLFASEVIDILARMKDSDVSVGLVPYPMYSETQGAYAHYVDNHLNAYSVPVSVPDIDTLSDFMELYAYHSRYLVRSAWIEAYSYEFCSDADSGEMLDIILDSRTYDPAYLMFASYEGDISGMISTGKNNLTRWADRTADAVNNSINNYVTTMSQANQ